MCVFVADIDNILHVNMLPHSDTSSWGHGARATLYPVTANSPPPWPRPPIGHCLLMSRLWLVESVSSPIPGLLWTQQLAEKLLVTFPLPWATILPRHHSVKLISRKSRIIIINLLSPRQTWACKNCFKNIFSYVFLIENKTFLWLIILTFRHTYARNSQVDPPSSLLSL